MALVGRAVDARARLAPEAADLRRRNRRERRGVLVQEHVHAALLVVQRVVVVSLLPLDMALARLGVEGAVAGPAARRAAG